MERKEKQTWVQLVIAIIVAAIVIIAIFGLLGKGIFDRGNTEAVGDAVQEEEVILVEDDYQKDEEAKVPQSHEAVVLDEATAEPALVTAEEDKNSIIEMPEARTNHTMVVPRVGEVSETAAAIELIYDLYLQNPAEAQIEYSQTGRRRSQLVTVELRPGDDSAFVVLENLEPDTSYRYLVTVEDTNNVAPTVSFAEGTFHTEEAEVDQVAPPSPEPEPVPEPRPVPQQIGRAHV